MGRNSLKIAPSNWGRESGADARAVRSAGVAAKKIKTPFYFYDADVVKARYHALCRALPDRWRVYYAAKANANVEILKVYKALGAKVECSSAGEMLAAFKAGYGGADMAVSGPVKTDLELNLIKTKRPSIIHCETAGELTALEALGIKLNVALRLNIPLNIPHENQGRIMSGGIDKFGFSAEEAQKALSRRGFYKNITFMGFHIYMGTQILSARSWIKGAESFVRCVVGISKNTVFSPKYLDFGGGFGIPYKKGEKELSLPELKAGIIKLEKTIFGSNELKNSQLFIEPGRYLMGPAGYYFMKVVALKKIRGIDFALTDGGIHHALFPFRVSREFPAFLANRKGAGKRKYVLGGPLCTTLDQSDLPITLPKLKVGDVIAIGNSGAYGYSTGMHFFLSHPLPAELLKDGKKLAVIREASESDHLFRHQTRRTV
jgi:diaminopimelate decarboxylase